jgi:hypothetical protein
LEKKRRRCPITLPRDQKRADRAAQARRSAILKSA